MAATTTIFSPLPLLYGKVVEQLKSARVPALGIQCFAEEIVQEVLSLADLPRCLWKSKVLLPKAAKKRGKQESLVSSEKKKVGLDSLSERESENVGKNSFY